MIENLFTLKSAWQAVQATLILAQFFLKNIYLLIDFSNACTDVRRALFKTKTHDYKDRLTTELITNKIHLRQRPYSQPSTAKESVVTKWRACYRQSTLNEKAEEGETRRCWQGRCSRRGRAFAFFFQPQDGKRVPITPRARETRTAWFPFEGHIYATQPLQIRIKHLFRGLEAGGEYFRKKVTYLGKSFQSPSNCK